MTGSATLSKNDARGLTLALQHLANGNPRYALSMIRATRVRAKLAAAFAEHGVTFESNGLALTFKGERLTINSGC